MDEEIKIIEAVEENRFLTSKDIAVDKNLNPNMLSDKTVRNVLSYHGLSAKR
jgi:hypothetical protein